MKKITILVDHLHSHGGIEKLVVIKANYWADVFGYQVTILATEQSDKPIIYQLSDKVKFIDLKINYHRNISYFSFKNLKKLFLNIKLVTSIVKKNKSDVVIVASHIPITYILPFLPIKAKTVKEFHFSKSIMSNTFSKKILEFIESKYNALIVLSDEERNFYRSKNVLVIPNPLLEIKNVEPANIHEKEDVAIFAGRLAPVKNLELLIEIWQRINREKPNWKLRIYGDTSGEYYEKIKKLVDDKILGDSVFFMGETSNLNCEFNKAKVFLMTSLNECFPMVILESFGMGVPVIANDCPTGPRNIITDEENGFLVKYNDIDDFVKTFNKFDDSIDLQKRMSEQAIETSKVYRVDKIMNMWNEKVFK